jgi:flagellar motor switch protein FliM
MEKILTQDEINQLLRAAQKPSPSSAGTLKTRRFSPFVFGKAAPISKQQVREVSDIHDAFAYRLKNRIGAYLQAVLEINPMSVEETPYVDFIQTLSQQSYLASLGVEPTNSIALLSLDFPVAFAMIDLMLGGNGKPQVPERRTTEIEEKVLQTVIDMICEELHAAWMQTVDVNFAFDQTQRVAELFRLLPPHEKVLFLTFEVRMLDVFSTLTLAFPATVSSLLLQRLARRTIRSKRPSPESAAMLRQRLELSEFPIEMLLPPKRMRGQDVLELKPGQTVLIQHETSRPAVIRIAGQTMLTAYPVRKGTQRGAMIQQVFPIPLPAEQVNL